MDVATTATSVVIGPVALAVELDVAITASSVVAEAVAGVVELDVETTAASVVAEAVALATTPALDKMEESEDCAATEAESVDDGVSEVIGRTVEEGPIEVVASAGADAGNVEVVL